MININKLMILALLPSVAFVAQSAAMAQNNNPEKHPALTVAVVMNVVGGRKNSRSVEPARSPSLSEQTHFSYSPVNNSDAYDSGFDEMFGGLKMEDVSPQESNITGKKRPRSDS